MNKYRVVITDLFSGNIVKKMIVNEEQKVVIENLYIYDCLNEQFELQIIPDDEEWEEFC